MRFHVGIDSHLCGRYPHEGFPPPPLFRPPRSGKTDPVQFKSIQRGFKQGAVLNAKWAFCKQLFSSQALNHMTLREKKIASKIAKFVFEKSPFETPLSVFHS